MTDEQRQRLRRRIVEAVKPMAEESARTETSKHKGSVDLEFMLLKETIKEEVKKAVEENKEHASLLFSAAVKEMNKIVKENEKSYNEELKKLEKKIPITRNYGGGSIYQDWKEDSTANGSLVGTANGVNTSFVMSNRAVNGVVFLYRNGVLESLADWSVLKDQKTIIYSGNFPQTGDTLQAKYPKG